MKRCGQWIILLWIAAVLLYPQAETTALVTRDTACELASRVPPAQSLVSTFSLKDSPRSEAPASPSPGDFQPVCHEPALGLVAPASVPMPLPRSRLALAPGAGPGRLPFAQGPPPIV